MAKHIVFWRLKETAHGNDKLTNARLIKEKVEDLCGQIPGLVRIEVGFDFSRTESSFDIALYSEFTSRRMLEAYREHPAHKAIMPFIKEACLERCVVDYEL